MIFGITEAEDASFDYSWTDKIDKTDLAILITKNITDKFISEILNWKDKVIVHATCTGYGQTVIEPNVPLYTEQMMQVRKLIRSGFSQNQIVVRIDPIIPTTKGLLNVEKIVADIYKDVNRFRVSVIDNYKHVQERFKKNKLPVLFGGQFQASFDDFKKVDTLLKKLKEKYGVVFEGCAEPYLNETEKIGCVSQKDLSLFGLKQDTTELSGQRKQCLCIAGKTELLSFERFGKCDKFGIEDSLGGHCGFNDNCKTCEHHDTFGCQNACLYCYWKS